LWGERVVFGVGVVEWVCFVLFFDFVLLVFVVVGVVGLVFGG